MDKVNPAESSCCEPQDATDATHKEVQNYYGEVLASSEDLKTSACCTVVEPDGHVKQALAEIHDEVMRRYYGCGLALPEALDGLRVLDLGCGAGRDVYLLSRLVGEQGSVVGVDMTPAQLEVAEKYQDYHRERFGYTDSNVEFLEGNIERLDELPLESGSFDAIISNCVINLAVDKAAVLNSAFRLLRDGGELYFSDIYADRRIPSELAADPVLYGECLSGALYWRDFINMAQQAGFAAALLVECHALDVEDPALAAKTGDIRFVSVTYRLFKASDCELSHENYGQTATYLGSLAEQPAEINFAAGLQFPAGQPVPVSGSVATMIVTSRFSDHFQVIDTNNHHLGLFSANFDEDPFRVASAADAPGGCC